MNITNLLLNIRPEANFAGKCSTNPVKNNEQKDTFVLSHKKDALAKTAASTNLLEKTRKMRAALQNFTGKFTGKSSDIIQYHYRIYFRDPEVEEFVNRRVEELIPNFDEIKNPLEKIDKAIEYIGRYSSDCNELSDREAGIRTILSDLKSKNKTPNIIEAALIEQKAIQLIPYYMAYKEIQVRADSFYNDALVYLIKLPKEMQDELLPQLEAKMEFIRKQHVDTKYCDRTTEAVASGDFIKLFI